MTDEKIRAAVEIAQKAIDLAHRVPPEALRKSKELMTLAHAVVELSAELAALKEKYRWRKRSEEPTPEGGAEALIQVGGDYVITHAVVFNDDTAYEKVTGRRIYLEYWRPLDLPNLPEEERHNDK